MKNLLWIIFIFCLTSSYGVAQKSLGKYKQLQQNIDSLLYEDITKVAPLLELHKDFADADSDTFQMMKSLIYYGDYYYELKELLKSTNYYISSSKFNTKGEEYDKLRCHGLAYAAYNYAELELHDRSKDAATSALQYAKVISDTSYLADCYSIIGAAYYQKSKMELAATYFDSCLHVEKILKDTTGIIKVLNNLGRLNVASKIPKKAISFYEEALALSEKIDPEGINASVIMSNLSDVHASTGKLTISASLLNKAIAIVEKNNQAQLICKNYLSLVHLQQRMGKQELSLITLEKLRLLGSACNQSSRVDYLTAKAQALMSMKEFDASIDTLHEAERLALLYDMPSRQVSVLKAKYDVYKNAGLSEDAITVNDQLAILEKEQAEKERIKKIAEVNAKYELDKKLQEIESLENMNSEKSNFITSLLSKIWWFLGFLGLFILGAVALYLKNSKKKNKLINSQKSKIDELSMELESIRSTIKQTVESDFRYQGKPPNINTVNSIIKTPLTPREFEILSALFEGKSNKEIGEALFLSINTVKFHLKNIYDKLEVKNRIQAVKSLTR